MVEEEEEEEEEVVKAIKVVALKVAAGALNLLRVHLEVGRALVELVRDELEHRHRREHRGRGEVHLEQAVRERGRNPGEAWGKAGGRAGERGGGGVAP